MNLFVFFTLAVLAVAQARILMLPNSLSAAMESNTIEEEPLVQFAMQTEKLFIPMSRYMQCDIRGCNAVCQMLGYKHGRCVNSTTCECYN